MRDNDFFVIAFLGTNGCGKTTIGKIITGLLKPTSGELYFDGVNIRQEAKKNKSNYRRNVQFIQQDSYAALNPVKTIYQSLCAALETHDPTITKEKTNSRIEELMSYVGLIPTAQYLFKYPHQLSGGMRQRVALIRTLAVNPDILSSTGMSRGGIFYVTALASAFGTLVMAFFSNCPLVLAPAMGLNAFFAYTVVGLMGFSWQFALFAVVFEGILFLLMSLCSIREKIVNAIMAIDGVFGVKCY